MELPEFFGLFLTVFLGLCLGSFATALSYRIPRDISIMTRTRSFCPSCNHALSFFDLIPVFSWLFLRGHCRYCKAKIGARYPLIELGTLALCLLFYWRFGFSPAGFALMLAAPVITSIADIDLHYKIIPDSLNLSLFVIGVIVLLLNAFNAGNAADYLESTALDAFLGAFLYAAFSLILRAVFMKIKKKEPLGLGDVKFFGVAGFFLGFHAEGFQYFLMFSGFGGVLLALVWRRLTGEKAFPFGPALLLAFIVTLLWLGGSFLEI